MANMFDLWAAVSRELHSRDVGITFARASSLEDLGLLGFVVLTAPNVRTAVETFIKYSSLLNDGVTWEIGATGTTVEIRRFGEADRALGMCLSHETALAQLVGSIRQLCGRSVAPSYVGFQHAGPKVKDTYRSFFGCEIDFSAPFDRVVLPRDVLGVEPRGANPALCRWLSSQADSELGQLAPRPLADRVRDVIGQARVSNGARSMKAVAASLGVSERTLRRSLAADGLSFRTLSNEARRDMASRMLVREGASVTRVAFETGFADPSAFAHACRRWFGRSPTQVAEDARPPRRSAFD